MDEIPFVFVIGTIKILAEIGATEKIVELCNQWLDVFESAEQPSAEGKCLWCADTGVVENNRYGSHPCTHCTNGALSLTQEGV